MRLSTGLERAYLMASFGVLAVDVLPDPSISEVTVVYAIFNLLDGNRTEGREEE